jgi:hypothetical protein
MSTRDFDSMSGYVDKKIYDSIFEQYDTENTITMVRKNGIWEMKKEKKRVKTIGDINSVPVYSMDSESTIRGYEPYLTVVDECGPIPDSLRNGSPAFPFRGRTEMAARTPDRCICQSSVSGANKREYRLSSVRRAIRSIAVTSTEAL